MSDIHIFKLSARECHVEKVDDDTDEEVEARMPKPIPTLPVAISSIIYMYRRSLMCSKNTLQC